MKKNIFLLTLTLCLFAGAAFAADGELSPTDAVQPMSLEGPTEAPETRPEADSAQINPLTGLPEVQWLGSPISEDARDGGGTGDNYICSATFQCPGDASFGIQPYTISCQGQFSCQTFSCGIKCDGFGMGCIPGPMC